MHIDIGDVSLFFDTEGAKLVDDGPHMRERPTLILLHGGPGFDHSHPQGMPRAARRAFPARLLRPPGQRPQRPQHARQVDPRPVGRRRVRLLHGARDREAGGAGLSFGGFVAQSYALRHPDHPAKIILSSTAGRMRYDRIFAMFERMGGAEVRRIAEDFWADASAPGVLEPYLERCFPLYNQTPQNPDLIKRAVMNEDMLGYFFGADGEGHRFDFLPRLAEVRCPTLVMSGEIDPVTPVEQSEDIAAALPVHLVRFERFAGCGHGVERDDQAAALRVIREFILE